MIIINEELRAKIDYYSYLIQNEIEYIKGFKKYNINNQELDDHYGLLMDFIISGADTIKSYIDKESEE